MGENGSDECGRACQDRAGRVILELSCMGEPQLVMGGPDPWPSMEPTTDSCTGLSGARSFLGVPLGLLGWELSLWLSRRQSQSRSSCP